jgi:hypothetical protein
MIMYTLAESGKGERKTGAYLFCEFWPLTLQEASGITVTLIWHYGDMISIAKSDSSH